MLHRRILLFAPSLVFATGCFVSRGVAAEGGAVIPVVRFRNDNSAFTAYSGIVDSLRLVIRDDAGLARLLAAHSQSFHTDAARCRRSISARNGFARLPSARARAPATTS
jgi:hypothetical protein